MRSTKSFASGSSWWSCPYLEARETNYTQVSKRARASYLGWLFFYLGDLDSNQEWRIQSPLFCRLNYLPILRKYRITRRVGLQVSRGARHARSIHHPVVSLLRDRKASSIRRMDSSLPSTSIVSKVGGETFCPVTAALSEPKTWPFL